MGMALGFPVTTPVCPTQLAVDGLDINPAASIGPASCFGRSSIAILFLLLDSRYDSKQIQPSTRQFLPILGFFMSKLKLWSHSRL
jgi:hypothetical protein